MFSKTLDIGLSVYPVLLQEPWVNLYLLFIFKNHTKFVKLEHTDQFLSFTSNNYPPTHNILLAFQMVKYM